MADQTPNTLRHARKSRVASAVTDPDLAAQARMEMPKLIEFAESLLPPPEQDALLDLKRNGTLAMLLFRHAEGARMQVIFRSLTPEMWTAMHLACALRRAEEAAPC